MRQSKVASDVGFVEKLDLEAEIGNLESLMPWPKGLTSRMLLKSADLRILLIAMQAGAIMKEHHSDGRTSIHLLRGRIRIRVAGQVQELSPQQVLLLDRSVKHDVKAIEPSVFLLTIAWPTDKDLIGMEHRGYGS